MTPKDDLPEPELFTPHGERLRTWNELNEEANRLYPPGSAVHLGERDWERWEKEDWKHVGLDEMIAWHAQLKPGRLKEILRRAIAILSEHKDGGP